MCISIHTPAKGVTADRGSRTGAGKDFNPHSREGSDLVIFTRLDRWFNFNPHSREGSDPVYGANMIMFAISIHTPAKGVTFSMMVDEALEKIFQSTLPRRE